MNASNKLSIIRQGVNKWINIGWNRPYKGFCKFNVDGSMKNEGHLAIADGILEMTKETRLGFFLAILGPTVCYKPS